MPERFDLNYVGEDNEEHRPVMIHRALQWQLRAVLLAMLIEHYEGRFLLCSRPNRSACPSPTTISVTPTALTKFDDFRVEVDGRDSTTERKIRAAHDDRVPYQIIVGDNEEDDGNISVRDRFEDQEYVMLRSRRSRAISRTKSRNSGPNRTSCSNDRYPVFRFFSPSVVHHSSRSF